MNLVEVTGALFFDLKKAFDTVNNELQKLESYGITNSALSWFSSYHRTQVYVSIQLSQM